MKTWRAYYRGRILSGGVVRLCADESHHMTRVLRLAAGAGMRLFDGEGGEWECTVETAEAGGVRVRVGSALNDQVEALTRVTLLQSTCRADRLETVLQKGTEIGVAEFVLVETAASEVLRLTPAKRDRWDRIILEACKQSGRRILPSLRGPAPLATVAASVDTSSGAALVLHPDEMRCSVAEAPGMAGGGPVRLLVGPESGFDDGEIDLLRQHGWQTVGLGPRTLRTETAGLVAASLVLAARGELGR